MKNLKSLFFASLLVASLTSCEKDDEKFSGSPVGTNNIVMLKGELDTDATFALTDQDVDFTITLPQKFSDTVNVEVTTISDSGRRVRESIEIKPDSLVKKGKIRAAGGAIFSTNFKMYISGIALQSAEPYGTHYLMTSDTLVIGTGVSSIPDQDLNRLKIKVVWPTPSTASNNLQMVIGRPALPDIIQPQLANDGKQHLINVSNTGGNSAAISTTPGDYTIKLKAQTLPSADPVDMPYIVIVVFPDGQAQTFSGTLFGLTLATPLTDVLKVTKNTNGTFVLTDLTN